MRRDDEYLDAAYRLALLGEGHTRPNPAVGAVVVRSNRIIGRGYHARAGGPHAEVAALADCRESPAGATVYVTLEPCSRAGRVGACTDALIAAKVARVVYACPDPNPKNRDRAKRILARAGIACERFSPKADDFSGVRVLAACRRLIAPFAKQITTGLPYVTVKLAMSLDGKICDNWGAARWVSSANARKETGKLREKVDAILVGAETVRTDNPSLLSHGAPNDDLIRVVVTRRGRIPRNAQILTDGKNPTLVYRSRTGCLREILADLASRGILHILCEGGLKLATALAEEGLVDSWMTVLTPKVIGTRPIAQAVRIREVACLQDW